MNDKKRDGDEKKAIMFRALTQMAIKILGITVTVCKFLMPLWDSFFARAPANLG